MFEVDKKQLILSGIFIFLFVILIDLLILNGNIKRSNNVFYKKYIEEIEYQNKNAQKRIDSLYILLNKSNRAIEELSAKKDKFKKIYIENDKRIDTLTNAGVVSEFRVFFTNID